MAVRWWGALLVLLAGGLTGVSVAESARRTVCLAEESERMTRLFHSLVCCRRLPLPEAVAGLKEAFPLRFPEPEELHRSLQDRSFAEIWADTVREMGLPARAEEILILLGIELSAGEEPERCFAPAFSELDGFKKACAAREKELVRLSPVLGLSAGALLAVVFL
ncbi:MAG: hypothetical protein IKO22_07600 [Oscillospiraceae bacterium]|nr:hypothetical protein [Oscillospiraceae bacterium]